MSSTPTDSLVGQRLEGRYDVLEHIADGGMASVYLAVDTRLDRDVALKVMRSHLVHDESFVARFRREARSAARLSHPGIVAVYDQGDDNGRMFLALEYVPGRTLREVLDDEGQLSPRAALDIMEPVLDALGHAHRAGLIHRDIKPENVIIREDGAIKVADFGLARAVTAHTSTSTNGMLMGTVAYLSPEQVERGVADARSDVYAAGLVLFEMLTGQKAFDGDTPINVAYQHVHQGVPALTSRAPGLPSSLEELVAAATSRDPDERPHDAIGFRDAVREVRHELSPADLDQRPTSAPTAELAQGATHQAVHAKTQRLDLPAQPADQTQRPPLATRPRRKVWPWVLVLLSAALFASTLWFFLAGPGKSVTIPTVAGQPLAQAENALTSRSLSFSVQEEFSENVARGVIISSDPGSGESVWQSSRVTLTVSKGPERYAVPNLAGISVGDAMAALTQANLTPGAQQQEFSETVATGVVISSDPGPGASLRPGTSVNLLVSKGKQPVEVADWTGKPLADAKDALSAAGLIVVSTDRRTDDTIPKNSIISQDPPSGTMHKGDTVTFVVSDGPPLVAVPNVVGQNVDRARATLTAAGFKVEVEGLFGGIFGTVRFQDPEGGGKAPKGSTITLKTV